MKLFMWIVELRVKRKGNKQRIKYLLEKLIRELEQQGYNMKSTVGEGGIYFSVYEHTNVYSISGHQAEVRIDKEEKKCQKK